MFRIPSIKCEPQNTLLEKYIKQEHDIAHEHNIKQEHYNKQEHDIAQEHNIKHEDIDESLIYKFDYNGYYNQCTYQCYTKDSKNTKENVEVQIKFEVDVINNAIYENIYRRDDNDFPSVVPTKYCSINSDIECNQNNFNLNIKSSTTTFAPTKHNVIISKKNNQIITEVDVIDDVKYESFFMRDNNYVPVASTIYYSINSRVENKPANYNINIKASNTHFTSTKNKATTSKKNLEKLHECFICNKFFAQASTLNTHEIIHKSHKPFNCAICKKSFAQKGHILIHMNKHKTLL